MTKSHTKTSPNSSNTKPRPAICNRCVRACLYVALSCVLPLSSCVTVKKGQMGPDGTNMLVTIAEITGMGKDATVENSHGTTLAAPYVEIKRPDGTIISASNAIVNMFDYEKIGGTSTIPSDLNAGANVLGATAKLGGLGKP